MIETLAPFEYAVPTRIMFGSGHASNLGKILTTNGYKSAFLVVDPGLHAGGHLTNVMQSLAGAGISYSVFTDIEPNPVDVAMESGAAQFKAAPCDVIIGIGGGSAMDTAKAIAMLATNPGRIREYDGNDIVPQDAWPLVLVPTTAGTGSEVTYNLSVTNADTHEKMAVRSVRNCAKLAVLDPELLVKLPASVAAAAGIDALVHAIESYVSNRATPPTRMIALEAIRLIGQSLERFVANRADSAAASNMLYAASLAGMCISHTGTGAAHAVARALGGRYNVVHGVACGILLEPVMRFNLETVLERYAEVGAALGAPAGGSVRERAAEAVERVHEIRVNVGLPERLPIVVEPADLPALAQWAAGSSGPNPRKTSVDDAKDLIAAVVTTT